MPREGRLHSVQPILSLADSPHGALCTQQLPHHRPLPRFCTSLGLEQPGTLQA